MSKWCKGKMDIGDISRDLLLKAANGDVPAFEEIYKFASGFVYNVALRIAGNREDAQEIAQEVFLRIFKNLKDFKFKSSFKTWVYRITVNTALNIRKKALKDLSRQAEYNENIYYKKAIQDDSPEKIIDTKTNEEMVNNLLAVLNPRHRACIVLREMQGLSYEEIAQVLKININTVRSRLKRAREILLKRGGYK
ncbi:MAG: sigma-70 family RNA polymerase sigma factor [bacterium]